MVCSKSKFRALYIFFLIVCIFLLLRSTKEAAGEVSEGKTKKEFCDTVNSKLHHFGWRHIICNPDRWEIFDYTTRGNPLLYQEFGFDDSQSKGPVNLMLCGVHGDEAVSVYQCFHMARYILFDDSSVLNNFRIVIAPIVNPDGFFANTRQNANGVDPNRNLPTKDWDRMAYKVWARYKKDPRKFPGERSGSEAESRLQAYLIDRYKPDKIISFHAPLGFLDFDGPGDQKFYNLVKVEQRAKFVGVNIEANTKRFVKLVDFPFFPGSLGNYAGNERKIPTYTIELVTNDTSKAYHYWSAMRYALIKALSYPVYDWEEGNPYLVAKSTVRKGKKNPETTIRSDSIRDHQAAAESSTGMNNDLSKQNKKAPLNKDAIIDLGLSPISLK